MAEKSVWCHTSRTCWKSASEVLKEAITGECHTSDSARNPPKEIPGKVFTGRYLTPLKSTLRKCWGKLLAWGPLGHHTMGARNWRSQLYCGFWMYKSCVCCRDWTVEKPWPDKEAHHSRGRNLFFFQVPIQHLLLTKHCANGLRRTICRVHLHYHGTDSEG